MFRTGAPYLFKESISSMKCREWESRHLEIIPEVWDEMTYTRSDGSNGGVDCR